MWPISTLPGFILSIDEHDPVEEPAGVSAAARVVVPDLEVDRRAEMFRTAQQKRTHAASLKVLQATSEQKREPCEPKTLLYHLRMSLWVI